MHVYQIPHRTCLSRVVGPDLGRFEQQQNQLRGVSVPEHPLHFGPGTSITSPLCSRGLGFGLSWSCILKYASSRGCGNVVIPQGFPKSVESMESRFLGFPCFPYSVISMARFGNARRTIKILQKPF